MSTSHHTAGPWRLIQGAMLAVEADGHLGPLAELRSRLDYGCMHPLVAQTREANARLIVAAPDLLEALDACMGTLAAYFPDAPVDSVIGKNIINARAAIAQAVQPEGAAS